MHYTFPLYIFFDIIQYLIFADIILSWLQLVWIKWKPQFLTSVINPMYSSVKKVFPTSIWPIDFTPIVILLAISFLVWIIELLNPWSYNYYQSYIY